MFRQGDVAVCLPSRESSASTSAPNSKMGLVQLSSRPSTTSPRTPRVSRRSSNAPSERHTIRMALAPAFPTKPVSREAIAAISHASRSRTSVRCAQQQDGPLTRPPGRSDRSLAAAQTGRMVQRDVPALGAHSRLKDPSRDRRLRVRWAEATDWRVSYSLRPRSDRGLSVSGNEGATSQGGRLGESWLC